MRLGAKRQATNIANKKRALNATIAIASALNIINSPLIIEKQKFAMTNNGALIISPHIPPSSIMFIKSIRNTMSIKSIADGKSHLTQNACLSGKYLLEKECTAVYKPTINDGTMHKITVPNFILTGEAYFLMLPRGSVLKNSCK